MNTFFGCEPEALEDLSERMLEDAERLIELIERLRELSSAVPWIGPDAEAHRRRTEVAASDGIGVVAGLRRGAATLQRDAAEQELASQAETSPVDLGRALRAEMPPHYARDGEESGTDGGAGSRLGGVTGLGVRRFVAGTPRLQDEGPLENPGRWVGGPFMAEDPPDLPTLPDPFDLPGGPGRWIGGPMMPLGTQPRLPEPTPIPEGEDFSLDPEFLEQAQQDRRLGLGAIPLVGTTQMLMGGHSAVDDFFDRTEQNLEQSGLEELAPAVSIARIPHTVSGIAIGEKSVLGQATSSLDRQIANVYQAGSEISSAVGDGDWAGAARAGERWMYRQADASADLLTATPVPAASEAAADLLGTGADVVETVHPEAAAPLRDAEQAVRGAGEDWESALDHLTDGERYYDLRRQYAPMPWDPR